MTTQPEPRSTSKPCVEFKTPTNEPVREWFVVTDRDERTWDRAYRSESGFIPTPISVPVVPKSALLAVEKERDELLKFKTMIEDASKRALIDEPQIEVSMDTDKWSASIARKMAWGKDAAIRLSIADRELDLLKRQLADLTASLSDPAKVYASVLRGTIALTPENAAAFIGAPEYAMLKERMADLSARLTAVRNALESKGGRGE
jgi:hypothetical protein